MFVLPFLIPPLELMELEGGGVLRGEQLAIDWAPRLEYRPYHCPLLSRFTLELQGYLTHKKTHPPRTLP